MVLQIAIFHLFLWLRGVTIFVAEGDVSLFPRELWLGMSLSSSDDKFPCVNGESNASLLEQGLANGSPCVPSGPLPVFINKVLLAHSLIHLFTYYLWLLLCYNG